MTRMQIQLEDTQLGKLHLRAKEEGLSLAMVVRQALDLYLTDRPTSALSPRQRRILEEAGQFASGKSDVSAHHDDHLAEAFGS